MSSFFRTDIANYVGQKGKFTLYCFNSNSDYRSNLCPCCLWIFAY